MKGLFQLEAARQARSKAAHMTLAGVQTIRSALAQAKDRGADPGQLDRIKRAARDALVIDIAAARRADEARIEKEIDLVRENYRKDYDRHRPEHETEIRVAVMRHQGMSAKELLKEAESVMGGQRAGQDPAILDSLSAAVKAVDPTMHELLRDHLVKARYDDPAIQTGIGKQLADDLDFSKKVHGGVFPMKTEDGKRFVVDIGTIEEQLEVEEADGGQS